MATFGSPLYCIAQGEKGLLLVGVAALDGSVSFPLDCLETDDRPFEDNGMEGVFTEVVVVGVAGIPDWAAPHICC